MNLIERWRTVLLLIVLIPIGILTKYYEGIFDTWVNNSLGGILYVIFWSVFAYLFFPRANKWIISGVVLIVTFLLEFLQLWHPGFLEVLRSSFIGNALLGMTFSWLDLIHYLIGFVFSLVFIKYLKKAERANY